MDSVAEGFEYNNGVWKATWHTQMGRELKLFVMGDADFMQSQSVPLQLQKLLNSIDASIDKASTFACDSEYRDDISLAGGMVVDSVVVNKRDEVKVWFILRGADRMIGITIHEDKAVDVFCDSP
jgi:hypothetical protein